MPYLSFDLDALNSLPDVAESAGIRAADVAYGLLRTWRHAWTKRNDTVQAAQVRGFFGGGDPVRTCEALVAFGFLERAGDGFRVCGSERYLRISEARSEAGKKSRRNLKQGQHLPSNSPAIAEQVLNNGPANAEQLLNKTPALTSSTEHRASSIESEEVGGHSPAPQKLGRPHDSAEAYWAWLMQERLAAGFGSERWFDGFRAFFREALEELNGDGQRLDEVVAAFSRDPFWRTKGLPMRALVKQWRSYIQQKGAA